MRKIHRSIEKVKMNRLSGTGRGRSTASTTKVGQVPVLHESFKPAHLPIDTDACVENRILISGDSGSVNSAATASYRMLRTRVLHRARANAWHIVGITSPGAGEGKTITAINLALTMSREKNNHVFLVDLDLRNPKICRYLRVGPVAEINDLFEGSAKPEDLFFTIGVDNLCIVGTSTGTDRSSEMLAAGKIELLFDYIRSISSDPLILVDLPPILSTDDALVMAPKMDACLLVVSEGKSRRDSTAKALEVLEEFTIAGIVLNRSRERLSDYYNS
jgi:Mrp family chromosome partitioning ATPase